MLHEGRSHGYDIVRAIEERERHGSIYPANLYRRIRDLLRRELIVEVGAPAGVENADRRRYLSITPLGRRVARAEAVRLTELVRDARAAKVLPA